MNLPYTCTFTVANYSGTSKPQSILDYFSEFMTELNKLLAEGIIIGEKTFKIKNKYICDTPARAYIKQVQGRTG